MRRPWFNSRVGSVAVARVKRKRCDLWRRILSGLRDGFSSRHSFLIHSIVGLLFGWCWAQPQLQSGAWLHNLFSPDELMDSREATWLRIVQLEQSKIILLSDGKKSSLLMNLYEGRDICGHFATRRQPPWRSSWHRKDRELNYRAMARALTKHCPKTPFHH